MKPSQEKLDWVVSVVGKAESICLLGLTIEEAQRFALTLRIPNVDTYIDIEEVDLGGDPDNINWEAGEV